MHSLSKLVRLSTLASIAYSMPTGTGTAKRSTCTVNSSDAASDLSSCYSVIIEAFTVDSGETVTISAASGAIITMDGDITFSESTSDGPLLTIDTDSVTFDGNGHTINGNGADYWDGEGTNGGVDKPHPFVKIKGSGTFSNFTVLNSPAQAISVGTDDTTTIKGVTVDNYGDADDLGHNTDGFDVSADDVTITGCTVKNQDDCIAINSGSSITFSDNFCSGGHGISIGSISSNKTVKNVTISGNTVTDSMYGLRIKVKAEATDASVSSITYSGNTISGISKYGLLITQSYPDDVGTPGTGGPISNVNFTGETTKITVNSSSVDVAVDCGACSGTWDWSSLSVSGGDEGDTDSDDATISGGSY